MPATIDPDQSDLMRTECLQLLTMPDRDQPVFGAMYDIGMTIYFPDPFIRT